MSDTSTPVTDAAVPADVPVPAPGAAEPVNPAPGVPVGARENGSGPPVDGVSAAARSLDLLHGVEMTVTVELGRTKMLLRDLLALQVGGIIELDRPTGSPVDVLINDTLLARGEVVVVDDDFGVRILDIVSSDEPVTRR
ncbi:MAG: flagellar motor switch protein FliN [Actinomycetota bacterium]|jgi:flagellar motor switch protein FliN/FliY|nr:flagellar motor switch protein FliN [Actinomycetota bacterium]